MLHLPHPLVEIHSKVFESDENECFWYFADPFLGTEISDDRRELDAVTASFYFVLPELTSDDGLLSLLTIARGLPDVDSGVAKFWDPVELRDVKGGIYAHVTYDPSRCRFEVSMNVGSDCRELQGVVLEGVSPELVCGRLLELYLEVSPGRIFASVHDYFAGREVSFEAEAKATGAKGRPWGEPPSGCWWVMSGITDERDGRGTSLPPGFGLSDLRITLGSEVDEAVGSLVYHGDLDHLIVVRPNPLAEELETLVQHARTLRRIAFDLERIRLLLPLTPRPSELGHRELQELGLGGLTLQDLIPLPEEEPSPSQKEKGIHDASIVERR